MKIKELWEKIKKIWTIDAPKEVKKLKKRIKK